MACTHGRAHGGEFIGPFHKAEAQYIKYQGSHWILISIFQVFSRYFQVNLKVFPGIFNVNRELQEYNTRVQDCVIKLHNWHLARKMKCICGYSGFSAINKIIFKNLSGLFLRTLYENEYENYVCVCLGIEKNRVKLFSKLLAITQDIIYMP